MARFPRTSNGNADAASHWEASSITTRSNRPSTRGSVPRADKFVMHHTGRAVSAGPTKACTSETRALPFAAAWMRLASRPAACHAFGRSDCV